MDIFNKIFNLVIATIMIAVIGFVGKESFLIYKSEKSYYTYDNLPTELKAIVSEFEFEANKHNVNVSRIKEVKFFIVDNNNLSFGGFAGVKGADFIVINSATGSYMKQIIWHELGHLILNYGHDTRKATSHIMNSGRSTVLYSDWTSKKNQFFTEPMPRNFIKNTMSSMTDNNYIFHESKEFIANLF